ncbi:hypothetical protein CK203_056810 [Vitis vinifera]|uniref:DUF4283 domain-containing protein n=1 Tax=Vitis vinifera TaxID=29760 RepID=A0A438GQC8_VITVI|nr:hypothetical protein CK203_056810 [Vitis vinifera]
MHMRGGKSGFAVDAKSFEISKDAFREKLKGIIMERSRGFTSWIKFGGLSLCCLLEGVEACCKGEHAKSSVRTESRVGVPEENAKESFADVLKSRVRRLGEAVWLQLGEKDVLSRRELLDWCLVGRWGEHSVSVPDLSALGLGVAKLFIGGCWLYLLCYLAVVGGATKGVESCPNVQKQGGREAGAVDCWRPDGDGFGVEIGSLLSASHCAEITIEALSEQASRALITNGRDLTRVVFLEADALPLMDPLRVILVDGRVTEGSSYSSKELGIVEEASEDFSERAIQEDLEEGEEAGTHSWSSSCLAKFSHCIGMPTEGGDLLCPKWGVSPIDELGERQLREGFSPMDEVLMSEVGDLSPMDREDLSMVEDVRNGPLSMILKDGSRVNLQSNCVIVESSLLVGEEEEAYVMGEGSALEVQRRDIPCF